MWLGCTCAPLGSGIIWQEATGLPFVHVRKKAPMTAAVPLQGKQPLATHSGHRPHGELEHLLPGHVDVGVGGVRGGAGGGGGGGRGVVRGGLLQRLEARACARRGTARRSSGAGEPWWSGVGEPWWSEAGEPWWSEAGARPKAAGTVRGWGAYIRQQMWCPSSCWGGKVVWTLVWVAPGQREQTPRALSRCSS